MKSFRAYLKESQIEDKYCRGYCGEFAVALHKVFGYKLGGFYEETDEDGDIYFDMVHLFAFHPSDNNKIIDARGIRTKKEVKASLFSSSGTPKKIVEKKTTEEDIDAESGEGLNLELVEEAEEYIKKHLKKYKVSK